ncbi:MAG: YkgJ family cysteine cluster protein [Methanomassiliicoccales archaeon]
MKCARCGKCCYETRMELSEEDVHRLEALGYSRKDFCESDKDGILRLRNVKGRCYFLLGNNECAVYPSRPLGCEIYPVNCDLDGEVFVDDFCSVASSVGKDEILRKGELLRRHLRVIDHEAALRKGKPV